VTRAARVVGVLLVAAGAASLLPRAGQAHGSLTTTVLFDREIVSLLERRCVSCHHEAGPSFPLSTYEQTWVRRLSMRTEVLRRHMPPWAAVPGYGEFANDNGLTPREAQFLVSWVEGLGPRNGGTTFLNVTAGVAAPTPVRAVARVGAWQLGTPDVIRPLESVTITPSARPVVHRATIDLRLTEPQRVGAIEFLPGDRRRLRAARFQLESTGQWLGSWTPWYGFAKLPPDVAFQLPTGARLLAELHYGAGTDPVTDVGAVGLFLARGASAPPADLVLTARPTPGRAGLRRGSARLPSGATIWALAPEIPPGTQSMELSARRPDGSTEILLLVERPSADWPTPYVLKSPIRLARGTELRVALETDARSTVPARVVVSRYASAARR
jgi:hypothetical protein